MKKPAIVLFFLLAVFYSHAQKIKAYEYWVDDDVSAKVVTSITPVQTLHLQQALSVNQVSAGLHLFNIRFADTTNTWSSILRQFFVKNPISNSDSRQIVGYEYWFDNIYATKTYQQITPSAQFHLAENLTLNSLSFGVHVMNIRFKDDMGNWSTILNQFFVYNPPSGISNRQMVGYEYWFDDGYASKTYQPIMPSAQFHLADNLNLSSLTYGLHRLNIRFKDDMASWSILMTQFFINYGALQIIPNHTVAYRFWFDNDMATEETYNLQQPAPVFNWADTVETPFLTIGSHIFNYEFKDSNQAFSSIRTDTFNVTSCLPHGGRTITGAASVCVGQSGVVYSIRKIKNAAGYTWSVPSGATIIAGSNTHSITVDYSLASLSGDVSVFATNSCGNGDTLVYPVTVHQLPHPTLAGVDSVCSGTSGWVYTTESDKTNYTWTISPGNFITAGGTPSSPSATVTWNSTGPQWLMVNYTNEFGCRDTTDTQFDLSVKQLPVPGISGASSVCVTSTGNVYTTQPGMTGYLWTVSPGGAITAGAGTNAITVSWNTTGVQTVSVNYMNAHNCTAAVPTAYDVTVYPLPVPEISGSSAVCLSFTGNGYTTQPGMTGYIWNVSAGGSISVGAGTNAITVTWNTTGAQTVSVNYTNANNCTAAAPVVYNVTVNPLPAASGTITGPAQVIPGQTGVVYAVSPIANATGYVWSLPAGATIASLSNTNSIIVNFGANAVSGDITVHGTNSCGNGIESLPFIVQVIPTIVSLENVTVGSGQINCYSAAQTIYTGGNGTSFSVQNGGSARMIAGQNILCRPVTKVALGGYISGSITTQSQYCGTQTPPMMAVIAGEQESAPTITGTSIKVYPNPTNNCFILEFAGENPSGRIDVIIYSMHGEKLLTHDMTGERSQMFSLAGWPAGVYIVHLITGVSAETAKIIKQ